MLPLALTCRNIDAGRMSGFSRTKQHRLQVPFVGSWPYIDGLGYSVTVPLVLLDVQSHADAQLYAGRLTFMLCPATIRMARLFPKEASC